MSKGQRAMSKGQYAKSNLVFYFKTYDMSYKKINETTVYKLAFDLAMKVFTVSRNFPKEETYSLTDQVRRSSRSVCSCLAEAHRKKLYPAHFISKVSDADMENSETQTWLDFALACTYIDQEIYTQQINISEHVGSLLHHMISNPEKYK